MYDTLSGSEILKKIGEEDVQCILAYALYQEVFGEDRSLVNTNDRMRFIYLEKAQHLIDKLNKYNFIIAHKKKDG